MTPFALRSFGGTLLVLWAAAYVVFGSVIPAAQPPNILLILTDDLGYGEVNVSQDHANYTLWD